MHRSSRRFSPAVTLIAAAALAAGCAAPSRGRQVGGIENFAKVQRRDDAQSYFYRGTRPTQRGIETLKRMGVKTVIDLSEDFDPREQQWARDAGMEYLLIKSDCKDIQPLQIATFLGKMRQFQREPNRWPVYVHDRHGRDSAGLYVAVWRIVEEGWGREAAIEELLNYGHRPDDRFGCPAIVPYLRRLDPSRFRSR